MKLSLFCDERQFDALWKAAHKRGRQVTIERAALLAVLQDHARVLANPHATITNEYPPATLARAGAAP
jgi:hypothetical protein